MSSDPDGPMWVNAFAAMTLPSPSLIQIAAAEAGNGFGTAIGSAPLLVLSWSSAPRACGRILSTKPPNPRYHGRCVSVILTSTYFEVHGDPFGSVLFPAPASP